MNRSSFLKASSIMLVCTFWLVPLKASSIIKCSSLLEYESQFQFAPYQDELQAVLEILDEVGPLTNKYFEQQKRHQSLKVTLKHGDELSPFTAADKEANTLIIEKLRRSYPSDLFIGEESVNEITESQVKGHNRVWFIDPIDGTYEFINGRNDWVVQIGLVVNGVVSFGVVYHPISQSLWFAIKGVGAYEYNTTSGLIKRMYRSSGVVSSVTLVEPMTGGPNEEARAGYNKLRMTRDGSTRRGSVGLKVVDVINGTGDLYFVTVPKTSVWDTCAPEIIAKEAGLRFSRMDRVSEHRWLSQDIDYTNGKITNEFSFAVAPLEIIEALEAP